MQNKNRSETLLLNVAHWGNLYEKLKDWDSCFEDFDVSEFFLKKLKF